jgi:hypothetical protein
MTVDPLKNKIAFVTGADSNYFPMLMEWIHSIRRFEQADNIAICVLDTGLTDPQRKILLEKVDRIEQPDWPCEIPARKIRGREFLKSCVCRPFINKIFDGYDIYFWLDSDTWIQDWDGPQYFIDGAHKGHMSVTTSADRAYSKAMRVKFFAGIPYKARSFYFTNAKRAFGIKTAVQLFPHHQIFAGAFCLHKDAPHWDVWQGLIVKALQSPFGKAFTAEQLTLGMMIYLKGLPAEILPAWTHWVCEYKPLWDEKNQQFVEPSLPHEPISILHLSGYDKMRVDRSDKTSFKTMTGQEISMSYRYPYFDGEKVIEEN